MEGNPRQPPGPGHGDGEEKIPPATLNYINLNFYKLKIYIFINK